MRKSMLNVVLVILTAVCLSLLSFQPASAKTLRWAFKSDVITLDPYSKISTFTINFVRQIYDTLVRLDSNLKIEPSLATSWERVDTKVWRFNLRKGVKFHNGNPFTADDVVASIERVNNPVAALKRLTEAVTGARKVDDYTVDILLRAPNPLFPSLLSSIMIMDKEWMTEHNCLIPADLKKKEIGYATTHTNGTGPFMLESRKPGIETVLVANPNWWDSNPQHNLTRVIFTPIKSDATRTAALLSGEIDFMHPAPLQDRERIRKAPGFKLMETLGLRVIMLFINQGPDEPNDSNIKGKNPLKDIRVRKALYQSIDIQMIKDKIMRGKSRVTGNFVAPEIKGRDPKLDKRLPYDLEKAKKLMAEAGYPNGFEIGFDAPNNLYMNDEKIAQAISAMWAKIGVRARLTTQAYSKLGPKRHAGKCDIWMLGFATIPYFHAYNTININLHSRKGNMGFWNPGGYVNPRIDELTSKIEWEPDEAKQMEMISEAFKLAQDDCVIIPLHQQPIAWGLSDNVTTTIFPDDNPRLYWIKMN